jgi:hypothetical protein
MVDSIELQDITSDILILKGSDDGVLQSWLLCFWSFSIVWYSKKKMIFISDDNSKFLNMVSSSWNTLYTLHNIKWCKWLHNNICKLDNCHSAQRIKFNDLRIYVSVGFFLWFERTQFVCRDWNYSVLFWHSSQKGRRNDVGTSDCLALIILKLASPQNSLFPCRNSWGCCNRCSLQHWFCCNTKTISEFSATDNWQVLWQCAVTNKK